MGMIIVPFLLFDALLFIAALVLVIVFMSKKKIDVKQIILGGTVSVLFWILVTLSFYLEGSIYAFAPYFRISIFLFILPFTIAMFMRLIKIEQVKKTSNVLLVNLVFIGIETILYFAFLDEITNSLNIDLYY